MQYINTTFREVAAFFEGVKQLEQSKSTFEIANR